MAGHFVPQPRFVRMNNDDTIEVIEYQDAPQTCMPIASGMDFVGGSVAAAKRDLSGVAFNNTVDGDGDDFMFSAEQAEWEAQYAQPPLPVHYTASPESSEPRFPPFSSFDFVSAQPGLTESPTFAEIMDADNSVPAAPVHEEYGPMDVDNSAPAPLVHEGNALMDVDAAVDSSAAAPPVHEGCFDPMDTDAAVDNTAFTLAGTGEHELTMPDAAVDMTAPAPVMEDDSQAMTFQAADPGQMLLLGEECKWEVAAGTPCGARFWDTADLHKHVLAEHKTPPLHQVCGWLACDHVPTRADARNRHLAQHTRLHKCFTCEKAFATKQLLDQHRSTKHGDTPDRFPCPGICDKVFNDIANWRRHVRGHFYRWQCLFCKEAGEKDAVFKRHDNCARHFRTCPHANGGIKRDDKWYPEGYQAGAGGMDKALVSKPT